MEVIISKEVFETLIEKINEIKSKMDVKSSPDKPRLKEDWLDAQEACVLLKISKRTLQGYRRNGLIPFSHVNGKVFFKARDIEKVLEKNYKKINW